MVCAGFCWWCLQLGVVALSGGFREVEFSIRGISGRPEFWSV